MVTKSRILLFVLSLSLVVSLFISGAPDSATALNNGLAPTPPMGWNSWNRFHCTINEGLIRQIADAMVSSGLRDAGYIYLTVDDCWSALTRDSNGNLQADPTDFPSGMKALGDYIHSRGLKYGLYTSIGSLTCTGKTPGSLNNEFRDVATFASWGVDYMKIDRCGPERDTLNYPEIYARYRDAVIAAGRPIVLSASTNGGAQEPWSWGATVAHQWRTTGDISDSWSSMLSRLDGNARFPGASVPGGVNDPDMLEVGNGGMTDTEYRAHFGMWALMAGPLIAGNDVRSTSSATRAILTHNEVLDIDQDPLVFQAIKVSDNGAGLQVWYKPTRLTGARAVGLFNRSASAATMSVNWSQIGLASGSATVRDVWARADRGTFTNGYSVSVPAHGLALLRIVGTDLPVSTGFLSDQPWTYVANGSGPVERDRSVNTSAAGDGNPIRLNGVTYAKGFGAHAPSAIEFRPNGACSSFTASVGVDDEVGSGGNVIFQVWADGNLLYESGVMTGSSATKSVNVDISGRTSLRLQVSGGTDGLTNDHGDWANAQVTCGGPTLTPTWTPTPTLPPQGNVYQAEAASLGGGVAVESNHTGFNGTGFVNFPLSGGFVQFNNADGGMGANATLRIRYALGATTSRTGLLIVNGNSRSITFPITANWDTWATQDVTVLLNSGTNNTIRFESNGQDLANLDQIEIIPSGGPTDTPTPTATSTSTPTATHTPTITPTLPPEDNIYQAEAASFGGGVTIDSANAGFLGTGYANFPLSGGFVQFNNVNGGTGGNAILRIRYALGATTSRTGLLIVNGTSQSITFNPTGAWTTWATQDVTVPLNSGTSNTIRFESNGQDLGNIDQIEAVLTSPSSSVEAESGTLSGAAVVANCTSCSGGQKVGYIGNGSANYVTLMVNAPASGNYTLTIYYLLSGTRALSVSVNGGAGTQLNLSGSSWSTPVSTTMTVSLNAGSNTIKFYNDSAYAPDLDRIVIQ